MERKSVIQTVHSNEDGQFGGKMFSLCENYFVYLSKEPNRNDDDPQLVPRLGKSGAVIPRLMETLLNKGYRLYVDNWYTSQELFPYLHENATAKCGTAQKNRIKLPRVFTETPPAKGEGSFRAYGDLLALQFNDKKEIYLLSTIHKENERKAIKDLRNKNININKAHKGTTTVIMGRHDKIKEEQVQLDDLNNCRPLEQPILEEKAKQKKSFQNSTKEIILIQ